MRPQIIIIEGADCTGKSTLLKAFQQHYDCPVWHMTCTKNLAIAMHDYQLNAVKNAITNLQTYSSKFIFDRLWPSEVVYGSIFRPDSSFQLSSQLLRELMSSYRVLYVFCMSAKSTEIHESQKDPDHPYDKKVHQDICTEYKRLFEQMLTPGSFYELKENERIIAYDMDYHRTGNTMIEFITSIGKTFL